MSTNREDKIRKIQKLLNLTSSSYEEEAKAAMLKAQALMSESGLSMSDIKVEEEPLSVNEEDIDIGKKVVPLWHSFLASTIADNFRCTLLIVRIGRNQKIMRVIGMEDDVELCTPTIHFALESLEKCWLKYKADREERKGPTNSRQHTEWIKNDYMRSFIEGVKKAFEEQVASMDIVLVQDALVKNHLNRMGIVRGKSTAKRSLRDQDAQNAGFRDGSSLRSKNKIENRVKRIA